MALSRPFKEDRLALPLPGTILLYVHRGHKDYQGRGAQDSHLDFHTAPELWTSTETTRLIRDGGKGERGYGGGGRG